MTAIIPNFSATGCASRMKNGRIGTYVHKYRMRAVFRAMSLLTLIATISVINYIFIDHEQTSNPHLINDPNRRLQDTDEESNMKGIFQIVAKPAWLMALYVFGVLYMFLALAIVCDEYFVPALEAMSGEYHLNLTPDIAGATLMAAGGSAPELFTSFIGTFQESEVGFGTIVGSAVFNVLFVIGMCSLLSRETLSLTWWPLFRDSTYYAIGLMVLAIFVGVVTPGLITWWESFILFLMYIGYIYIMSINEKLHSFISGKKFSAADKSEGGLENLGMRNITFRTGLLTLIREPDSWIDKARIGFVAKVSGNVDDVFDLIDENGDGELSREEIKLCLEKIEGNNEDDNENQNVTEEEVDEIMTDIDTDKDGLVSKKEFRAWYIKSEAHISRQIKKVFDSYDFDKSGSIYKVEFKTMLKEVEPGVTEDEIEDAIAECFKDENETDLPFEAFFEWYLHCSWYQKHTKAADSDEPKTICENLLPPCDAGCFGIIKYLFLFPIISTLTLTVPDVRRPGMQKGCWCYFAFIISICWIGIYSYFMVGWTETIGNTLGIDIFIMGLTFLAAGTSVPDLLSSVIVARNGEGDMAVSSSIGSNIFDILVGLPIPWLAFALWPTKPTAVVIGAEGVWISIMILLGMLVLIVVTIHCSGWKLTKVLGFTMFFFYFCFLAQAILRWLFVG